MKAANRTMISILVASLTVLAVAGSGAVFAQGTGPSVLASVDDDETVSESNVSITEQEAIDIATTELNGTAEEIELENEHDTPVYEVEIVASNESDGEVAVDANDGTVLETEIDDDDERDDDDETVIERNVSVTEQEAIDIATAEVNGTAEEVELENEDGTPMYEVELVTSNRSMVDVSVHANDGTVLEVERDDDEEDDDERDDGERDDDEEDDEERDDDEEDDEERDDDEEDDDNKSDDE